MKYLQFCYLTVKFALWQRFKFDKARLVQLEDVLDVRLLQAPTFGGARFWTIIKYYNEILKWKFKVKLEV